MSSSGLKTINFQNMTKDNKHQKLSDSTDTAIAYSTCYAQFFRYEWQEYASHDYDGELIAPLYPNPKLELRTYDLLKETEKGYWIGYKGFPFKKWIPKKSKRRYAYPTKEEALKNFITRTKRRVNILQRQIECCKISISLAERTVI